MLVVYSAPLWVGLSDCVLVELMAGWKVAKKEISQAAALDIGEAAKKVFGVVDDSVDMLAFESVAW